MADSAVNPGALTLVVAGATGLVGRQIVQQLSVDPRVGAVHALVRKPADLPPSKVQQHVLDLAALPALPRCDALLIALGTTIKVAGSQAAFQAVDFDAVVSVAKAAKAAGCTRIGVVSALGPSKASPVFYSRVKAEMEEAVAALGYARTVFARPSFIDGDREALGQLSRPGEGIALKAARAFDFLIPRRYKAVPATAIATALIRATLNGTGPQVLESEELLGAAA